MRQNRKRRGRRGMGEEGERKERRMRKGWRKKIKGEEGRVEGTSGILTLVNSPPLLVSGLELFEILRYLLNMPLS